MMDTSVVIALGGLALAIAAHAFSTVWWAAKVTFSLDSIKNELMSVKDELKAENVESKIQMKAIWKKQDELKDRILVLEQNR